MSQVWLARDLVLDREVAVKMLTGPGGFLRPNAARAEALAAARLTHPHIASVFDYGEAPTASGGTVAFVVMERLHGRPLSEMDLPMAPTPALRLIAEVAAALAVAHAAGVVHRDVKPANVMVTPNGAKVFDFGLAAWVGTLEGRDSGDRILGTPAYMAPERLNGGAVGAAGDVYALGVLLHRLLTGGLPWSATTPAEMIAAQARDKPAPLPLIDGVPPEVCGLATACLATEPGQRPTAAEAALILASAAGIAAPLVDIDIGAPYAAAPAPAASNDVTTTVPPVPATASVPSRRFTRRSAASSVIGIAAFAVIGVAAIHQTLSPDASAHDGSPPAAGNGTSHEVANPGTDLTVSVSPSVSDTGALPAHASSLGGHGDPSASTPPGSPVPPDPTPTPPPASGGPKTFPSLGGSVVATCDGTLAYLQSWTPAPGYKVMNLHRGPDTNASLIFHANQSRITVSITCPAGQPESSITGE
jgi:serine/threonine protein kinase